MRWFCSAASRGLATLSTTHVALLQAWDDSLVHTGQGVPLSITSNRRLHSVVWRSKQAVNFGGNPEWDLEMLIAHPPSALCIYPFGNPIDDASWSEDVPIVPILEYLEPHTLWDGLNGCGSLDGWSARSQATRLQSVSSRFRRGMRRCEPRPRSMGSFGYSRGAWSKANGMLQGGSSFIARLLNDAGVEYVFAGI